jgi:hypothetical protein
MPVPCSSMEEIQKKAIAFIHQCIGLEVEGEAWNKTNQQWGTQRRMAVSVELHTMSDNIRTDIASHFIQLPVLLAWR